ncbi:methyltransferase domain-containing protein [Leptospira mtsangambouensis]|uniref:Methyltransferase domain-containing protein n=1 Tax=Leptospira mtsangambouensis TaxID=2484912 RepID=A0ABY2P4V8_9LEPT|nr:methyltransferase domain-containing protein [Leptospira mtsangambouensis]TGM82259.1 methyltransferase domain-containing protein [Leptospira mtsangambouensis]
MKKRILVNLGCGSRFHQDWLNFDFVSRSKDVIAVDLRKGIPVEDSTVSVIYSSHVLEHFSRGKVNHFLQEIYRSLEPGGILRIVVPDLEQIVRAYIEQLDRAKNGNNSALVRADWLVHELLDQIQRNVSGGETIQWWNQDPIPEADYIYERLGDEFYNYIGSKDQVNRELSFIVRSKIMVRSMIRILFDFLLKAMGYSWEMAEIGKFRLSGEVHYWMYDSVSLGQLLKANHFANIKVCRSDESAIPNFSSYNLDIDENGKTRKPDSLFIEATKES